MKVGEEQHDKHQEEQRSWRRLWEQRPGADLRAPPLDVRRPRAPPRLQLRLLGARTSGRRVRVQSEADDIHHHDPVHASGGFVDLQETGPVRLRGVVLGGDPAPGETRGDLWTRDPLVHRHAVQSAAGGDRRGEGGHVESRFW